MAAVQYLKANYIFFKKKKSAHTQTKNELKHFGKKKNTEILLMILKNYLLLPSKNSLSETIQWEVSKKSPCTFVLNSTGDFGRI